jgi:orotate phosphoribosyltransferase
MLVAESMGLPFVYVRPEPKKHGRQNQVEGFAKGQNVVVVEDLISTGNSSHKPLKLCASRCHERHGCYIHIWVCCFGRKF